MTTVVRFDGVLCCDCGKGASCYFPPGSFGLASASFLCVSCAEERVAALNYEMYVREASHDRARELLDAVKATSEPPAPPLPSGTLCRGKPPLPDAVVDGGKNGGEDKTEKV
jgi:hypothetical protein